MYYCDISYIVVLNFAKRTSFSNICTNVLILRQHLRILLPKPTMICLLFVFWLLGVIITGFVFKIVFTQIVGLIHITFIIYFILKLYISINVFMQNLAIFLGMSCICFLGFYPYLYFTVLCFFAILLLICVFVNLFHVFRSIVNLFIFYFYVELMLMLAEI